MAWYLGIEVYGTDNSIYLIFQITVIQKCQHCELCVLRQNSVATEAKSQRAVVFVIIIFKGFSYDNNTINMEWNDVNKNVVNINHDKLIQKIREFTPLFMELIYSLIGDLDFYFFSPSG